MIKNYLRKKFINWLVKDLFIAITKDDVLQVRGKDVVIYKGKQLDAEQLLNLKEDVERFADSVVWKFLSDDAKYQASIRMYERSTDIQGMMFGKAVLFAIDVIEEKMKQLKNI